MSKKLYFFPAAQSPVPNQRTDSLKRSRIVANSSPIPCTTELPKQIVASYQYSSAILAPTSISLPSTPKMMAGMRHGGSHIPSPKGSPMRRANLSAQNSPKRQVSGEEKWVDGPRLSKSKVHEARHMMRESSHVKQCETWIDGPKLAPNTPTKSLVQGALPGSSSTQTYGYMDNHKKSMIRQWVENQTCQVFPPSAGAATATGVAQQIHIMQYKKCNSDDEEICIEATLNEIVNPITECLISAKNALLSQEPTKTRSISQQEQDSDRFEMESMRSAMSSHKQHDSQEDEDQDSGPSEVPPALPLIEPLSSREISHDSLHIMCSRHVSRENLGMNIQTIDCGLQVTEEDIARTMGWGW